MHRGGCPRFDFQNLGLGVFSVSSILLQPVGCFEFSMIQFKFLCNACRNATFFISVNFRPFAVK